jgi:glycosyltransferase involved in cell wall biosynthesis
MVAARVPTVCQLVHSLGVGGAEILAARLARRLRDRFRFVFVCLDDAGLLSGDIRADGFGVHVLGRRPGLDWGCPLRLARVLRAERVDVVHAHQYAPFVYGLASRLGGAQPPILFTEHGRHQPDYPRPKRVLANRLLLARRDRVVGVGRAVRRALIDNEGIPARRVGVVYNGVDVDGVAAAPDPAIARRELGAAPTDFVLLQVARLDYLKDHPTAVRTLARVAAVAPQARLVLVGDGPERAAIESQVQALGMSGHVRLLGTRSDVGRLLHGADAFLLTSTSEGIPLTVIEAMAAGLPVVSTDVGGVREVVADGETGLLAPAGDDAALTAHVLRLAGDADLRRRMGAAGRTRAKDHFDEPRMCADYGAIYRELAGQGASGQEGR